MVRNIKKQTNRGFTLIELLVVVAIIGILATAGIPQYKRMVAKSKQSEAKVALGEIATSQSAFFAEYGGYGNNLRAMGVQSDIANETNTIVANKIANLIYKFGFLDALGAALGGTAIPAPNAAGNQVEQALAANNPAYNTFGATCLTAGLDTSSICFGRVTLTPAGGATLAVYPIAPTYAAYTANAMGVVKPGLNKTTDCIAANGNCDVWTVNQNREVANTIAGF